MVVAMDWNRRTFLKRALAVPAGHWLARYEALAAPALGRVKITDLKAVLLRGHYNSIVKIETDAGLAGYGEAGMNGEMTRAWLKIFKPFLVGDDPLQVARHFQKLTSQVHPYQASIPAVSGVDIALWDLAGKITGLPVSTLLGGSFRDRIRLYINGAPRDMLDLASCRQWAQALRQERFGWNAVKINAMHPLGRQGGPWEPVPKLTSTDVSKVGKAFANAREALGPDMDIMAHLHNELDLPSAIAVARAVEPARPLWLEDPLQVQYSESWRTLRRSISVPLLTGEKLEAPRQFLPFLENQAVDMVHIDLAFLGGLTVGRRVADLAALHRVPIVCHNIGTLALLMASAHYGASVFNFVASENVLGSGYGVERQSKTHPPVVKDGYLEVPNRPGIGAEFDESFLRANLAPGEPWWG